MSRKHSVLIVDDDENILKVVGAILRDKGYTVETAKTGNDAIVKSQRNTYDLMLIDLRLPDMGGIELLTKVHDTVPKVRKVIVTGYPTIQNAVASVNGSADAYIMKPFEIEKMLETIKEQLKKQQQERRFSEKRIAEFIQTRVEELVSGEA